MNREDFEELAERAGNFLQGFRVTIRVGGRRAGEVDALLGSALNDLGTQDWDAGGLDFQPGMLCHAALQG